MSDESELKNKLDTVLKNIEIICKKVGRDPHEVRLLAAVKYAEPPEINKLVGLGCRIIGENKAQQLVEKYNAVDAAADWHFIGQLQTNKVKYIIDKVSLIHSCDRQSLAVEIDRQAKKINKCMQVLIQINTGGGETRGGVDFEEAEDFADFVSQCQNLRLRGIMTVLPYGVPEHIIRENCLKMSKICDKIRLRYIEADILSMGMSDDYHIALEYGANLLRLGSVLFR